jgi:hypothetical protein
LIERIIIAIVTSLGAKLIELAMARIASKQKTALENEEIDRRLDQLKIAMGEVSDGAPVTKEQRKHLNEAIRNFIRGPSDRM